MLVLSGFLLGRRQRMLCTAAKGTAPAEAVTLFTQLVDGAGCVWSYAMHRALRLWPMLIMCLALQVGPYVHRRPHSPTPSAVHLTPLPAQTLLGDAVTSSTGGWLRNAAQVLGFVTPIDLNRASVSLTASWAAALDFQCGAMCPRTRTQPRNPPPPPPPVASAGSCMVGGVVSRV
jgi:peptidoglycan/LPS O-acetylase OafA/YrhL